MMSQVIILLGINRDKIFRFYKEIWKICVDDNIIWNFAQTNDYIIVSKDSDFHQKSLLWGHPPKFIYLRVGNCPTSYIIQVLINNYPTIVTFAENETESILVLM